MDPGFQPYNNSPNQKNPNPYPQYNPYQNPETHSGPNKYPTLPPIQNPQHPQPYPQNNQNKAEYPGYIPPAQYGEAQTVPIQPENREKTELDEQLAKFDQDLETGYLKCYVTISYLIGVGCGLGAYNLFDAFMSSPKSERNFFLVIIFSAVWLAVQSYFAVAAYGQKHLTKATVACWMMMISLIPLLFIEMFWIALVDNESTRGSKNGVVVAKVFMVLNSILLLIHVFVNIVGAFKVRGILLERAKIEMKFDHPLNNA